MKRLMIACAVALIAAAGIAAETVKPVSAWLLDLSNLETSVREVDRQTRRIAHTDALRALLAIDSADLAVRVYELNRSERNAIDAEIAIKRAYAETTGFIEEATRQIDEKGDVIHPD